jgi:hypothetical protein
MGFETWPLVRSVVENPFANIAPADGENLHVFDTLQLTADASMARTSVRKALTIFDIAPADTEYPRGVAILCHTARIIKKATLNTPIYIPLTFHRELKKTWEEGIFETTLSWHTNHAKSARLYHLGVHADEHGRVVIMRVQKHLLGLEYRTTNEALKEHRIHEKRIGDGIWRNIESASGFQAELFGFLITSMIYGPHATNGEILFPIPERQPEVMSREYLIRHYEKKADSEAPQKIARLSNEIEMIKKKTDFSSMLSSMAVVHEQYEQSQFRKTTMKNILAGIHSQWTDDSHHDRHELRRILYSLYHAQH